VREDEALNREERKMESKKSMIGILVAMVAWTGSLPTQVEAFAPMSVQGTSGRLSYSRSVSQKSIRPAPLQSSMDDMFGAMETPEETRERIQELIDEHPVLLFMKGSKLFPQCGFSNTATKVLDALQTDFHAVDVLSDAAIRQGIKDFSQWPTIPQLYIRGEFIGGCDIMVEMYQTGELAALLEENES
jgi:monothiol glutaredoxin